jgi:adenine-specific DNA-methyltransferase
MRVGYMGTKKFLAPHVRTVIDECADGPVLDVFSGMGAVGETLANDRPLWVNDIQAFAAQAGTARFTSKYDAPTRRSAESGLVELFDANRARLNSRFARVVAREQDAFAAGSVAALRAVSGSASGAVTSIRPRRGYDLFTSLYGGTYFSVGQCIEIDSLRFAIDHYKSRRGQEDKRRWLLIALGIAMLRVATSTGHFAQYLEPKANNLRFICKQRRRSVAESFWSELENLRPVGSVEWRLTNRVFNSDALGLMRNMYLFGPRPSVVYADPPYTKDQYSRYYHLWETLVFYDYPTISGKGRYRAGRFRTAFAVKSEVLQAMRSLASLAALMQSDLVLSYPQRGLLSAVNCSIPELLKSHFKHVDCRVKIQHSHSTMGGSKGQVSNKVVETIYLARN